MAETKKQPAIPMMIGDYFKDPLLGQASLVSRGVWYEVLMYMWEGDRRGEIVTTPIRLMGLVRCRDINEILHFLNELVEIEFGYIKFEKEINFPVSLENCNTKVTLRNRRMYAEYKDRQNTRLRVQKYREKQSVTKKKRKCNTKVTPSLSISSSITKNNIEYPSWLDLKLWKEYKKYRTKIKAPLTDHAEQLSLTALKEQIDAGYKQADVINATIQSGKWKSFFPPKNKTPTGQYKPPKETPTPDYLIELVGNIGKKIKEV